jgi:hypothetical protein
MEHLISFQFTRREYTAPVHLSLQENNGYIFTFLDDKDLVSEFGRDVDIHTDCEGGL